MEPGQIAYDTAFTEGHEDYPWEDAEKWKKQFYANIEADVREADRAALIEEFAPPTEWYQNDDGWWRAIGIALHDDTEYAEGDGSRAVWQRFQALVAEREREKGE